MRYMPRAEKVESIGYQGDIDSKLVCCYIRNDIEVQVSKSIHDSLIKEVKRMLTNSEVRKI